VALKLKHILEKAFKHVTNILVHQERIAFHQILLLAQTKQHRESLHKQLQSGSVKEGQMQLQTDIKKHEQLCVRLDDATEDIKREKGKGQRETKYLQELKEREQHLHKEYTGLRDKMSSGSNERVQVKDLD